MSDIRVKSNVGQQVIKANVGQQNSLKVVSSVSGAAGGVAFYAQNVTGGIASVTQLYVSGPSNFIGIATFNNNVYFNQNVYIDGTLSSDSLSLDSITANEFITTKDLSATGFSTFSNLTVVGFTTLNSLNVAGISTFNNFANFNNSVDIENNLVVNGTSTLYGFVTIDDSVDINNNLNVDGTSVLNILDVNGYATFNGLTDSATAVFNNLDVNGNANFEQFFYNSYNENGIAYFNSNGLLVSTGNPLNSIDYTNKILTTDVSGYPVWSSVIDGGDY